MRSNSTATARRRALNPQGLGLAIPTRGDKPTSPVILHRLRDELDAETIPVLIDEPDHVRRCGPSSDAKS